ncbi:MAG TPA: hypothetical protein VK021_00430 [Flavobacteriaceae bacterium]|nr:hypothetical protein [Flavobacteriaceae bacterium]
MDTEVTKMEIIRLLLNTNDKNLLLRVKHLFQNESKDWWDNLNKEERKEIEKGLQQADRGELKSHKEVLTHFDKWK